MQKREKNILIVLVAAVALYAVGQFCYWVFYLPWAERFDASRKQAEKTRQAKLTKAKLPELKKEWAKLGSRTYSAEAEKMHDVMQDLLVDVMEDRAGNGQHALKRSAGTVLVSPTAPKVRNASQVQADGTAELKGEGNLAGVFRALFEVQHNPRLGRVESVTIQRKDRGYLLHIPRYDAKWMNQPTIVDTAMKFTAADLPKTSITPFDKSPYALLSRETMFTLWKKEEPPTVVAKPPVKPPPATQPTVKPPPVTPPPDYHHLVFTAIYEKADGFYASITDKNGPGLMVRQGQRVADGTIVEINHQDRYLVLAVGEERFAVRSGKSLADRESMKTFVPIDPVLDSGGLAEH